MEEGLRTLPWGAIASHSWGRLARAMSILRGVGLECHCLQINGNRQRGLVFKGFWFLHYWAAGMDPEPCSWYPSPSNHDHYLIYVHIVVISQTRMRNIVPMCQADFVTCAIVNVAFSVYTDSLMSSSWAVPSMPRPFLVSCYT